MKLVSTPYGKFHCEDGDLITGQLEEFGAHTRNELAMLLGFVRPDDFVIDVGAHLGTFAVPIARLLSPRGRLVAFEANADNFAVLSKNVAVNGLQDRIDLVNFVVAQKSGSYRYVPMAGNTGGGEYFHQPKASGPGVQQQAVGLDQWARQQGARPLDVLKVDAEGMEVSVLQSGADLLGRDHPLLYLEINLAALHRHGADADQLGEILLRLGYRFFRNKGPRNSAHDNFRIVETEAPGGPEVHYDVLCIHAASLRLDQALQQVRAVES